MRRPSKPFIIPVFLPHSGCPHQCLFCNQSAVTGTAEDLSPDMLDDHVNRLLAYKSPERGPVQISFYGGNFLGLPEGRRHDFLEAAETFVQSGRVDGIRFSTRPDTITTETLAQIRPFSVTSVEVGVQSMDDTVLAISRRGHTAEQSRDAILCLKEAGYETTAQMMTGLPGDSGQATMKTAEKIVGLKPDGIRIYPTVVIAKTALARQYQRGDYAPQSLDEAVSLAKNLYRLFCEHGITVIRMGLQASDELSRDDVMLAGPAHPAFGHLVLSELFFDHIVQATQDSDAIGRNLIVKVHPRNISRARGLKNNNLEQLKRRLDVATIKISEDSRLKDSATAGPETITIARQ